MNLAHPGSNSLRWVQFTILAAILAGSLLRILEFTRGYSFYVDECALALNLGVFTIDAEHGTAQQNLVAQVLAQDPTAHEQSAPTGFRFLESATARLLGPNERALRLIPLLADLLTLALFWPLSQRLQPKWAGACAIWLVAVNQTLIMYSATAKQYSMEALVEVLIFLLCYPFFGDENISLWTVATRAISAGALLWFSFSAVFVLAGIGMTLFIQSLVSRSTPRIFRTAQLIMIWIVMLVPVYFLSMRSRLASRTLHNFYLGDYAPLHGGMLVWLGSRFTELAALVSNRHLALIAVALLFAGFTIAVLRREWIYIAAGTIVLLCIAAAVLQVYPFISRLVLFAFPGVILLLTRGAQGAVEMLSGRLRPLALLAAVIGMLWCAQSAVRATIFSHGFVDEPRETLRFLRRNWRPGDRIFATEYATPCTVYYSPQLGLDPSAIAADVGANESQARTMSLSVPLPPARLWLVEMRTPWLQRGQSVPVREFVQARGRQLAQFDMEWSSVVLYDMGLSPQPSTASAAHLPF